MGPVATSSDDGLGTPRDNKNDKEPTQTQEVGQMDWNLRQFSDAVMRHLAKRGGREAASTFRRAYRFDASRGGWCETQWGSALVARLYAKWWAAMASRDGMAAASATTSE